MSEEAKMQNDFPNVKPFVPGKNTAISPCPYIPPRRIKNFVDMRSLSDDERILENPHKGWYWHYIDNGFGRGAYRELHDENDALSDFPCLNHLYLRFDWGDIERGDGVFDWSYIDEIMDKWGARGYTFALRICCYEGIEKIPFATPRFVFEKGAKGYDVGGGRIEPDYSDPVFLYYLERFLSEAGRKFDGDPRIETVDIGSFGTWGEGHTAGGTNIRYGADVIIKHMEINRRCFPKSFLMFNDDLVNSCWERGVDENMRILELASEMKMGFDDDSVCVSCYCGRGIGYTTLRSPWMLDYVGRDAPVTLELEHYHMIKPQNFKDGYPFVEAMRTVGATFAGFHGYPRPWLEKYPYVTEYAANRLGYWYFIDGAEFSRFEDGAPVLHGAEDTVTLYIENRGFARAFHGYRLLVKLSGEVEKSFTVDCDNREWKPREEVAVAVTPDVSDMPRGKYRLSVGLFDGNRPVCFALKKKLYSDDGFAEITEVKII